MAQRRLPAPVRSPANSPAHAQARFAKASKSFILALAQVRVTSGARRENLQRALDRIEKAAQAGAQVVLLPETMDLGWTYPRARQMAEPVPSGSFCRTLRRAAIRHGVYVCAGLTEASGSRVYNAAVLISPTGEVVLHHRKLNELAIGHKMYDQGDRLAVVPTPYGTFGLMICADARADGECITRALGMMGADLILSPSAWAVPPDWDSGRMHRRYGVEWRESYGAVARDYRVWVAGCSNVGPIEAGPWKRRVCIGCSLVINPHGEPAAYGSFGVGADELLLVRVTPYRRPARGDKWREYHERQRLARTRSAS